MRCNNCGWNNPEGVSRCQKCNQLLTDNSEEKLKDDDGIDVCKECGYPLYDGITRCPNCGYDSQTPSEPVVRSEEVSKTKIMSDISKTVSLGAKEEAVPHVNQPYNGIDQQSSQNSNSSLKKNHPTNKSVDLRRTMAEDSFIDQVEVLSEQAMKNLHDLKTEQSASAKEEPYTYTFKCVDGGADIIIRTSSNLKVKEGDIILVAGLRYKF